MLAWGPTGREVYERTYSRTRPDGTQETWPDTVQRVVHGNAALVSPEYLEPGEVERLEQLLLGFGALPAGRHLWTSGVPGKTFNRNCHRAGWGPTLAGHFTFLLDELMKGGGVGANYSSEYLTDLRIRGRVHLVVGIDSAHPDAAEVDEIEPTTLAWGKAHPDDHYLVRVADSREGWVSAVETLIDLAERKGRHVLEVDVSAIRHRGQPLHGIGGTASGPGPFVRALYNVALILNEHGKGRLDPITAMEVDHALAECVVSGNIRRSARMSIMHWRDPAIWRFLLCKADAAHHWSTNISVEVDDAYFVALEDHDPWARRVHDLVVAGMLRNGEPGYFNSSLASHYEVGDVRCTNPCGEIALEPWESCNLGHVNLAAFDHDPFGDEVLEAFRLMTRFLLRATFADITDDRQRAVENRNRRIGVGFFGFHEWLTAGLGTRYSEAPDSPVVAEALRTFKRAVREEAFAYASQLGVPHPIKATTIAPTGTVAKLPGVSEGIHPIYARHFERRVRYSANDPRLAELAARGITIEDCIYTSGTKVAVFHVRDTILEHAPEELVEQANEIGLDTMLAVQEMVQREYADNAVSYTVNVEPDAVSHDELSRALRRRLPHLKGTTVMVDASRPQAPYTRISREQYEAATDHQLGVGYEECANGACPVR